MLLHQPWPETNGIQSLEGGCSREKGWKRELRGIDPGISGMLWRNNWLKILKCRKQPLDSKNASGDQKAFLKQKTKKEMACEDAGIIYNLQMVVFSIVMLFFGGCTTPTGDTRHPAFQMGKNTKNMPPGHRWQQATIPSRHSFKCCDVGRFRGPMNLGSRGPGVKKVRKGNCKMGPRWRVMSGVMVSTKWPYKWVTGGFVHPYKWSHWPLLKSGVFWVHFVVGKPTCLPFIWEMQSARITGPLFIAIFSW